MNKPRQPNIGALDPKKRKRKIPRRAMRLKWLLKILSFLLSILNIVWKIIRFFKG